MRPIECNSKVMVLTGYPDSQMQYQGFEAIVIAIDGDHYKVRDQQGQVFDCQASELAKLDQPKPH